MAIERANDIEALFQPLGDHPFVVMRAAVGDAEHELHPGEVAFTRAMSPARMATFTAGRSAARAGLQALGVAPGPVSIDRGGIPGWPSGVIGSITHTESVAYAVVAAADDPSSYAVGIDAEQRRRVGRDVLSLVMTTNEQEVWSRLDPAGADRFATTLFSAKEALYKAQFVFTGAWLGFEHVEASIGTETSGTDTSGLSDTVFEETPSSPLDPAVGRPLRALSQVGADQVVSGVVLFRPTSRERPC